MSQDILERKPPVADARIGYGTGASQFGDLWLPGEGKGPGGFPVVVVIHGGWWQAGYGLGYCGFLCAALRAQGVAVWSVEYRRVGDAGGGWPGTMQDVAAGFDFVGTLGKRYPLDLQRIVVAGHSAGGQLAFWLAGRHHIPPNSVLHEPQPKLGIRGLVGLAGAVDLRLDEELGGVFFYANARPAAESLMGGPANEWPDRYHAANPGDLLPLSVPQVLLQGSEDDQIPAKLPGRWAAMARRQGDAVEVMMLPGAGHFDVVDPQSKVWPAVRAAVLKMLR